MDVRAPPLAGRSISAGYKFYFKKLFSHSHAGGPSFLKSPAAG